jgi:O-antigen ligase
MSPVRARWYHLLGALIVLALCAWTILSAALRGGDPVPAVLLLVTATGGYMGGRLLGGRFPAAVLGIVAVLVTGAALASGPRAMSGEPTAPPLGYANADGLLYALGLAAAAAVATISGTRRVRVAAALLSFALLGLTAASGSVAATVLASGIGLTAVSAHRLGRRFVLVGASVALTAVALTTGAALSYGSAPANALERLLTERRVTLWQEATDITVREPVLGVGPRRFAALSPTAKADPDARWAHSLYLQTAAETGIPGAALLGTLVMWLYGSIARSCPPLAAIGTATLTAFAVHAAIDYVASFPAVVLTAALLVGVVSASRAGSPNNGRLGADPADRTKHFSPRRLKT